MKLITGNTFPVKDQIKALGGRWNPLQKAWEVPDDKESQAISLVNGAGPKIFNSFNNNNKPKPFIHYRCKDCGCTASKYNKIYKNGQCKDCWLGDKEEREMGY